MSWMQFLLPSNRWRKRAIAYLFHCTFASNNHTQRILNLSQRLRVPCWGWSLPQQVGFPLGPTRNTGTCNLGFVWPVTGFVAFGRLGNLNKSQIFSKVQLGIGLISIGTDRDRKSENMIAASDSYTGAVWIMHQMIWRKQAVGLFEQLKVASVNDNQNAMVGWRSHFCTYIMGFCASALSQPGRCCSRQV